MLLLRKTGNRWWETLFKWVALERGFEGVIMPIYIKSRIVKVTCRDCGWHLVVSRGGFGDCLTGGNALRFVLSRLGEHCHACKSTATSVTPAGWLAYINPVESIRRMYWVLVSGFRWRA